MPHIPDTPNPPNLMHLSHPKANSSPVGIIHTNERDSVAMFGGSYQPPGVYSMLTSRLKASLRMDRVSRKCKQTSGVENYMYSGRSTDRASDVFSCGVLGLNFRQRCPERALQAKQAFRCTLLQFRPSFLLLRPDYLELHSLRQIFGPVCLSSTHF
jgi:hypothetical protein